MYAEMFANCQPITEVPNIDPPGAEQLRKCWAEASEGLSIKQ